MSIQRRMSRALMLLTLAAMLLSAAGCGQAGSSGTSDSAATSTTEPTTAVDNGATTGTTPVTGSTDTNTPAASAGVDFDWKKYAGTTLKVYIADTGQVPLIKPHLSEFEQLTGIKVNIESADVTSYRNNLPIRLTARSSDFDVMATFPEVDGLQFSSNGWYEPLDSYLSDAAKTNPDYDPSDFPAGVQQASKVEGKTVTMLWEMQTDLVYYRKDLLQEKGLQVPSTFEEWEKAAAALHDPGAGIYGFALRGIPYQTTTPYSSFLYAFCGQWITPDGRAAINSKEAMDAWMQYGTLGSKYGPPGITGFDWPVPAQQFQQGKIFAFLDINLFVPTLEDPSKSQVAGKVGYALVPEGACGRAPFIGGWGYGINPFAKNKDAAWYFIQWATSKPLNLEMKLTGWPSPRASAWDSAEFKATDKTPEFTSVVLKSLDIAKARMNPPVSPGKEAREIAGVVGNKSLEGVSRDELQKVADTQNSKLQDLLDKMKK